MVWRRFVHHFVENGRDPRTGKWHVFCSENITYKNMRYIIFRYDQVNIFCVLLESFFSQLLNKPSSETERYPDKGFFLFNSSWPFCYAMVFTRNNHQCFEFCAFFVLHFSIIFKVRLSKRRNDAKKATFNHPSRYPKTTEILRQEKHDGWHFYESFHHKLKRKLRKQEEQKHTCSRHFQMHCKRRAWSILFLVLHSSTYFLREKCA